MKNIIRNGIEIDHGILEVKEKKNSENLEKKIEKKDIMKKSTNIRGRIVQVADHQMKKIQEKDLEAGTVEETKISIQVAI